MLAFAPIAVAAWLAEPMPEFMLAVCTPEKLLNAPLSNLIDPVSTSPARSPAPPAMTATPVTEADNSIEVRTAVELSVLLESRTELSVLLSTSEVEIEFVSELFESLISVEVVVSFETVLFVSVL